MNSERDYNRKAGYFYAAAGVTAIGAALATVPIVYQTAQSNQLPLYLTDVGYALSAVALVFGAGSLYKSFTRFTQQ